MKMKNKAFWWNDKDKVWDDSLEYYTYQEVKQKTPLDMVVDFQIAFNQPVGVKYEYLSELDNLRFRLVKEEFEEVKEAMEPEHLLKELADLVYVVYGYAATFGWDLDEAVRRVHISNMSKLDPTTGKPIYREDGKVLKGSNYKEPDLSDLV